MKPFFLFVTLAAIAFYGGAKATVLGQVTATTSAPTAGSADQQSSIQATLEAFEQQQQILSTEVQNLVAGGASPAQLDAWRATNANAIAAQQLRIQTLTLASELKQHGENLHLQVPANVSPALQAFLSGQISLANAQAKMHSQMLQLMANTPVTLNSLSQKEMMVNKQFQQQNTALLSLQAQRARALSAAQVASVHPLSSQTIIPTNATPQLAQYLTIRDQIRRQLVQLKQQYASAPSATREQAIQTWCQQNAAKFTQLQMAAKAVSEGSTLSQN